VREAVAEAAEDRLRFLLRLDHELKNPLTAIRAGLANIEQAGAMATAGTSADRAVASVSAQANRITRLLGDLRKLADLETREIEAAPVDLPGLLHEVREAAGAIPSASERVIRMNVPQAPWPLPHIEGDRDSVVHRAAESGCQRGQVLRARRHGGSTRQRGRQLAASGGG
jgi:signal transduction histidine kinase